MSKKKISYSKQKIYKNDIISVNKVLKSNLLTQGPNILKFEKSLSKITESKYTVVVNSATSALHVACASLGLKKNDAVWTSANTFVASSNSAIYLGAKIDLIDINLTNYNLDVKKLEEKLKIAKIKKKLPKILITVCFAGHPCEMLKIKELSKKYNFKIIDDASHALGASFNKKKVGDNNYSDLTIFSFHPVKMITTGEGGAITTNDKNLYEKLKMFRSHGITNEKKFLKKKNYPKWYFEQHYLGYNYRMTDFQAALGFEQLKKLRYFVKKRRTIVKIYNKYLKSLPIQLPIESKNVISSYHLYVILVNLPNKGRNKLYNHLLKNNIETNVHYIPIYRHPYYKKFNFKKTNFKNTEKYFKQCLSLPIHPSLSKKEIKKIIYYIKLFFIK